MTVVFILLLALMLSACSPSPQPATRSMYYWSTAFRLDSVKENFLREHQIKRLYIRYFDVVQTEEGAPMPNATIAFRDKVPQGIEVVPTVFIVNDCMKADTGDLAGKLLRRILQMNETHDIAGVGEIQIDCDWTKTTRERYFRFLQQLRTLAKEQGIALSVTIRLHQLSQTPPPADRGVLMMYNTGEFTDLRCEHPILDMHDVRPYLRYLKGYGLPLATAYPLYRWRIAFRNGRYIGILHTDGELPLLPGDSIVVRQPALGTILEARQAVGERRPDANRETILFDLNNTNITRFKPDEYEKIYLQ